jgi:hypothetical protein
MSVVGKSIQIRGTTDNWYPPLPMADYGVAMTSATYGNGWYQSSSSSESSPSWKAFDQSTATNGWMSAATLYNTASPFAYTGTEKTAALPARTIYAGEWLQMRLPHTILLASYQLTANDSSGPASFALLGSLDGLEWNLVDSRLNLVWTPTETKTFIVTSSPAAYSYYRVVVTHVTSNHGQVHVQECRLQGKHVVLSSDGGNMGINVSAPTAALEIGGDVLVRGQVSAPHLSMFRNRVINGGMMIANRGTTATEGSTFNGFVIDRFGAYKDASDGCTITYSQQPITDHPAFSYALRALVSGATATPAMRFIGTGIEGGSLRDCQIGRAQCVPVTLSFWVKSSVTGASHVRARYTNNGTSTLANIVIPYTIHNSSVWERKVITIPPVVTNPLDVTATSWLQLAWVLSPGAAAWNAGTAVNLWQNQQHYHGSGQLNLVNTSGNQFWLTGVQLERGTIASPFEHRPFQMEDWLCKRYYENGIFNTGRIWATVGTFGHGFTVPFSVYKRIVPAAIGGTFTSILTATGSVNTIHQNNFTLKMNATTGDNAQGQIAWTADVDQFY